MLGIYNIKDRCTGCGACCSVCPQKCVHMNEDAEGFLYPAVDTEKCINCGLCEKVCPAVNIVNTHEPIAVYAALNNCAETVLKSSSGGVFSLLAEKVIAENGVVFGAELNERNRVVHSYAESHEKIASFMGSKYVQSELGNTYTEAEAFLKQGRKVLFSGTPCQIAGLKRYLRKDYEGLVTVDFICHGAPSPKVWRVYLTELLGKDADKKAEISFRDKKYGWERYSLSVEAEKKNGKKYVLSEDLRVNPYLDGFRKDFYLRRSCYDCPVKAGRSQSDITLADFWSIRKELPEYYNENGVSMVLLNTEKGRAVFRAVAEKMRYGIVDKEMVRKYNSAFYNSAPWTDDRKRFFSMFPRYGVKRTVKKLNRAGLIPRAKRYILRKLGRL